MKQSFKYGLLLVLTLLIHSVTSQAMEDNSREIPSAYCQEECYVSQGSPMHNALERLYIYYPIQTGDLGHTDPSHVPADKSIQFLLNYFRGYKNPQDYSDAHSHPMPRFLSNPITHYIYGLRKIII